jgi:hypothetical protein
MEISDSAKDWTVAAGIIAFGVILFRGAEAGIKAKQAMYEKLPWPLNSLAPSVGGEVNVYLVKGGAAVFVIAGFGLLLKNIYDVIAG